MKLDKNRLYELLRTVPSGRVTTYKELAQAMGTKAYRAIGQILKQNPDAPNTPCHRVVSSNGTLGGYMGKTKGDTLLIKKKLLQKEGVQIKENRVSGFKQSLYRFLH